MPYGIDNDNWADMTQAERDKVADAALKAQLQKEQEDRDRMTEYRLKQGIG